MRFLRVRGRAGHENLGPAGPAMMGRRVSPRRAAGKHPASRARPVRYPGRRSTGVETDGATDAQEVDVPTHDEQRIRNTHDSRITCNGSGCPGQVRHVDSAGGHTLGHVGGNRVALGPIPRPSDKAHTSQVRPRGCVRAGVGRPLLRAGWNYPRAQARQPWRIQLSGGSDSEGTDAVGGWCWQSHQVSPGQSS